MPELWPRPGGILYGANLYQKPYGEQRQIIDAMLVPGLSVCIISESQAVSMPNIVYTIHELRPGCRVGLEVSSWGGWTNPATIGQWPLRGTFYKVALENDWVMKYENGVPVTTSPGFGLVDLTIPEASRWYVQAVMARFAEVGADFIFFDECHIRIGHLPNADLIRLQAMSGGLSRDDAWRAYATVPLLRRVGIPAMPNGNVRQEDAGVIIQGRFIQNALSNVPRTIETALAHVLTRDDPMLILEDQCWNGVTDQIRLISLSALLGGAYQIGTPGWRVPMAVPIQSGILGEPLTDPNSDQRVFERGTAYRMSLSLRSVAI